MAQRYSIGAQIMEVQRELKMRKSVYGRMSFPNSTFRTRSEADLALQIMASVLETLEWARDNRPAIVDYIRSKKPDAAA